MKENIIQKKSYEFALKIIETYKILVETKKEFILSKQVLRSGTSVGANVEEAIGACSEKDFVSKLTIAYKEARETRYWLKLLRDSHTLEALSANNLILLCDEICKIIGKIQVSMKNKNNS